MYNLFHLYRIHLFTHSCILKNTSKVRVFIPHLGKKKVIPMLTLFDVNKLYYLRVLYNTILLFYFPIQKGL